MLGLQRAIGRVRHKQTRSSPLYFIFMALHFISRKRNGVYHSTPMRCWGGYYYSCWDSSAGQVWHQRVSVLILSLEILYE